MASWRAFKALMLMFGISSCVGEILIKRLETETILIPHPSDQSIDIPVDGKTCAMIVVTKASFKYLLRLD